jgi:hypothetical protein
MPLVVPERSADVRDTEHLTGINKVRVLQHRFVGFKYFLVMRPLARAINPFSNVPKVIALFNCYQLWLLGLPPESETLSSPASTFDTPKVLPTAIMTFSKID